jgi:hypothetical protein
MLAVKAKFDHGKIDWEEPPPFTGSCDLIVIVPATEEPAVSASRAAKRRCIDAIQERFKKNIPRTVSLVDELIAERRQEAARE